MGEAGIRERISVSSAWSVSKQLGRGQYGTAYLVEWTGNIPAGGNGGGDPGTFAVGDQAVAKVVGLEFLPEKEHALAFQEVELMRKLRHPYIVALIDHFLTEASLELCIVMDFCDSGDLRGEVRKRAGAKPPNHIPEAQVMTWFVQLTLALNYIHQRHILHRDLKSSNVFMNAEGSGGHEVKIGDFGIARVLEGTVDVAATVVGTPYYMSPEVCKSEPYGYKSDIWALGCVLYEMCMLKHAFESQSLLGLVYKIVSETYDPIPPQYSSDLRALLDRILDKSHFQRPDGKGLIADPYVKKFVPAGNAASCVGLGVIREDDTLRSQPQAQQPQQQAPPPRAPPPPKASLQPSRVAGGRPQRPGLGHARGPEPWPFPPEAAAHGRNNAMGTSVPEEPVRRHWTSAAPAAAGAGGGGGGIPMSEEELRAQVLLRRICIALVQRRQNWLQVFASFDRAGNGQLQEAEFEKALTSMALGLSDAEIREVRAHLQGIGSTCVPVDRFGAALHQAPQEVLRLEDWGRALLADLTREAAAVGGATSAVAPGALVRVHGLTSPVGLRLNGSEGFVDSWDPLACRWVVQLNPDGIRKSVRDENLLVLRPAAASAAGTTQDNTTALYRLLCEGGETAVPEERFLSVVRRLVPHIGETEQCRLVLLLPKTQDGRIDAPEVLGQFAKGGIFAEQTQRMAGPPLPGAGATLGPGPSAAALHAGGMLRRTAQHQPSPSPLIANRGLGSATAGNRPPPPPGVVLSPRAAGGGVAAFRHPTLGGGGGGSSSSTAPAAQDSMRAEVTLLRLAQRLLGVHSMVSGPGMDVLRLFASPAHIDEVRLEELLDAASVLPLGISRAEVQAVFAHIQSTVGSNGGRAGPRDAIPFAALASAAEAANTAGVPSEAAALERLDMSRLSMALQRLGGAGGGRASLQDFRLALMQAEPYLTPGQLEWLMLLTDKDGEGRLLPRSLLARLSPGTTALKGAATGGAVAHVFVPPRPPGAAHGCIARNTPRSVVVAVTLSRVRDRLQAVSRGPKLQLDSVLSLFDLETKSLVNRTQLASLLGHLRLGVSAAEADEVVSSLLSTGSGVNVALSNVFEAMLRAGEPEGMLRVSEIRDIARERLQGRGDALVAAIMATTDGGDWLAETEFRRCLGSMLPQPTDDDLEDRLVLLAEKNVGGEIWWRGFAQSYAAWEEPDSWEDSASPRSPNFPGAGRKKMFGATAGPSGKIEATAAAPGYSQQSWRSQKAQQVAMQQSARAGLATATLEKDAMGEDPTAVPSAPLPARCRCVVS